MKRLIQASCAAAILGLTICTLRAQTAEPAAATPAAAATETPAAPAAAEPAAKAAATEAPADATKTDAAKPPTPDLEQRVASMEAYFANSDPTVPLKGKDGTIPKGLTTIAASNPGPGHNAWQMV